MSPWVSRGKGNPFAGTAWAAGTTPVRGCPGMPCIVPAQPAPPPGGWLGWYGTDPCWLIPFEAAARRELGTSLSVRADLGVLTYMAHQVSAPGDRRMHDIAIRFYAVPPYPTYGLPPEEYPQVHARAGEGSPHRMRDDSLCLWHPHDSVEKRWVPADGLLGLIKLACNHLFVEDWYREQGEWLIAQAPHGLPRREAM
jgi:hypothetical protein